MKKRFTESQIVAAIKKQEAGIAVKEICRELQVLEEAIATHGKPEIVNSDQGSQYTSALWTQYLESQGIQISMDGKGRALDNVWIERFWRLLKYDYVYLNPADDGFERYEGVQNHIAYYHYKIHHTTCETPNQRYEKSIRIAA